MEFANRYDGIDENATRIIRHAARKLIGHFDFTESDLPDLEQDLMLDLHRRLPKFDPQRSKRTTFITTVVDHRIATIIAARCAGKRDYRLCIFSLNESTEDADGNKVEHVDKLDKDDYLRKTERLSRSTQELGDLSIDLNKALHGLSTEHRDLCHRLLRGDTVTEISRATGISRSSIYDTMKKICQQFKKSGLQEYL